MEDPIQLETDAKGSLYLPMLIDEVPTMALVDTGSTISVVHPSILTRLPDDVAVQMNSQVGQIRLADGSMIDTLGTVQLKVQLGADKESWTYDWVVSEVETPVVIGVNFLRDHRCTLDVRAGTLTVGDTVHVCRYRGSMPQVFRIKVAETVEVPARSEMIIPGEMADTSYLTLGVIEGNGQPMCDGNVLVARAILNPSDNVLPLRVMNLSGEPQKLYKGTNIATCEPVTAVRETSFVDHISSMSHAESGCPGKDDGEFHLPSHIGKLIDDCEQYLTVDEKDMAECLVHEFQQGFAKSKNDLSTTDVDQHSMTMISQQRVKLGPRRLALAKRKALKCELER